MDKQYIKCGVSPIEFINPHDYDKTTVEILRNYTFTGSLEKITTDYWKSYITVFNSLIAKYEEVINK